MSETADRYLRTGTDVPQIYPGTLKGVTDGLRDVQALSERHPGVHSIDAVFSGKRVGFRMYENGECIWQMEQLPAT